RAQVVYCSSQFKTIALIIRIVTVCLVVFSSGLGVPCAMICSYKDSTFVFSVLYLHCMPWCVCIRAPVFFEIPGGVYIRFIQTMYLSRNFNGLSPCLAMVC